MGTRGAGARRPGGRTSSAKTGCASARSRGLRNWLMEGGTFRRSYSTFFWRCRRTLRGHLTNRDRSVLCCTSLPMRKFLAFLGYRASLSAAAEAEAALALGAAAAGLAGFALFAALPLCGGTRPGRGARGQARGGGLAEGGGQWEGRNWEGAGGRGEGTASRNTGGSGTHHRVEIALEDG